MTAPHIPPMNALRAFEAAARLGSFKAAADELNVTPSAVSHQIANLEASLRVSLFHRNGRHLSLSEPGERYWRQVRDALSRLAAATEAIADAAGPHVLTVVAAPSLAGKWLMPRLDGFLRAHPDLRVRVEASADRRRLGDADAGIFYGPPAEPGLIVTPIITERMAVLCSPTLLRDGPPLEKPEDLAGHVLIHARNRVPWRDWLAARGLEDLPVRRELAVERSSLGIDAAIRGVGVILESDFLTADELRDGRLVEPFAGDHRTPPEPAYFLATRGTPAGALADFANWLTSEIGGSGS